MKFYTFLFFLCINVCSLDAQQLYKSRSLSPLDTKKSIGIWKTNEEERQTMVQSQSVKKDSCCCDTIVKLLNEIEEDEYPKIAIIGSGSISGNIDSTIASSGKLHVVLMPNERWTVYGAINKGMKSDTIELNESPPIRNLLFPDANVVGYQVGISHSLRLKTWENGGRKMDLNCVPFAEYMIQKRTFISKDTLNSTQRSFYASNLFLGAGLELNFFQGKNTVSIDFKGGYSRLNVANNDVEDFRGVFANLITQTGVSLDDKYTGFFFQSAIKINGAGLFYKYANMNAGNELTVKGLTGGQHFFGVILSAELWKN